MSSFDWVITVLTVLSVICIPLLVVAFRGAVKWTRIEGNLSGLVEDVHELVLDQDHVRADMLAQMTSDRHENAAAHRDILAQMSLDRDATDKRLRFIEEFWMHEGQGRHLMRDGR